jgi:predicted esterase YcpF (UPF0227 family)
MKISKTKILFLHGLESLPGGQKVEKLQSEGHSVLNPSLPKDSFEESIAIAQKIVDSESPEVIVGSSRGGAIAMHLNPKGAKIILIAPAWKHFGENTNRTISEKSTILHSAHDGIVDWKDSAQLALMSGANLITVGKDHRMNDKITLSKLCDLVRE